MGGKIYVFVLTYISRTCLICSSLLFFSSMSSDSDDPALICSSSSLLTSRISCSCWGRFSLMFLFLKPSYLDERNHGNKFSSI